MPRPLVYPSFIAADFASIQNELAWLNTSEADALHLDVADGHFVSNIMLGFPVLESICRHALLPLDFHLMLQDPMPYLSRYAALGASCITVHQEVAHPLKLIDKIHALGCQAGIAINPNTQVEDIQELLPHLDSVLIMLVHPGQYGQEMLPFCIEKIKQTQALMRSLSYKAKIVADGGISLSNARQVIEAGADALVSGKYVFAAKDKNQAISAIKALPFE